MNSNEAVTANHPLSAAWFQTLFRTIVAAVVSVLAIVHPGFSLPAEVETFVPMLALVAASIDGAVYTREHAKTVRATALPANMVAVTPLARNTGSAGGSTSVVLNGGV